MTGRGRAGTREKWRRAVLASSLADAVKVTLIAHSLYMSDQGYVSVPRETIADLIGKHPRKIAEHIATAVTAGFLEKIGGGYRGVTAQYVAIIPNPERVPRQGYQSPSNLLANGTLYRHPFSRDSAGKGAASGVPITRACIPVTRKRDDDERNARGERDHLLTEERQRREEPTDSLLAATLRKLGGRRPVCTGLRRPETVAA